MGYVMLAWVGNDDSALESVLDTLDVERVILLRVDDESVPDTFQSVLEKVPTQERILADESWEAVFEEVQELDDSIDDDVLINVSTGDALQSCMTMSAAFVNGIKAVGVREGDVITLPLMQFSYENALTERKRELLRLIYEDNCCSSLEELSDRSGLSKPLISYHVNGNLKTEGMVEMGLVETTKHEGKRAISLTTLGRLLVKNTIPAENA